MVEEDVAEDDVAEDEVVEDDVAEDDAYNPSKTPLYVISGCVKMSAE